MIVIDCGSGMPCENNTDVVQKMVDRIEKKITNDKDIVLLWHMFQVNKENVPLRGNVFNYAYCAAKYKSYKTAACVYDIDSLNFILRYKHLAFIAINKDIDLLPDIKDYLGIKITRDLSEIKVINYKDIDKAERK